MHTLNTKQYEAIHYLTGPCLVLAGAGSGKTRVITQKIIHLIEEQGYAAKHIAALTFTNKAASEMQERISLGLKNPKDAKQCTIATFHALGVNILRQEAAILGLRPQFSILDSHDCFAIIQDLLHTTDKALIRRTQMDISLWKNSLTTPEEAQHVAQSDHEQQSARVYQHYLATLSAYQAVDFDDLIRLTVTLFQHHEAIREKWQRRLRYLLIDEYQDTNTCQYALLKLLVTGLNKKPLFTAVGDDDQAIYAWRGATIKNISTLQTDFPDLKVIKLEQNYRSTTRILDAANAVIAHNPKLFEKRLWSEYGLGDPIHVTAMQHEEHEAEQVVFTLSAHRFERRAKFSDYAILYRGNHQARLIELALRKENIPYTVSGGQSYFDKAEIKDILSYLRLIANQNDDPAFIRAITTPKRGIGDTTLTILGEFAKQWQCSLFEACCKSGLEAKLTERQLHPLQRFSRFILSLEARAHKTDVTNDSAAQVLDDLMLEIDYETYLYHTFEERQAQQKWQTVLDFMAWLKEKSMGGKSGLEEEKSLMAITQMLSLMSMLEGREEKADAVQLSTLHAAKGLEFPHVFLIGIEEGILPHKGDRDEASEALATRIEEERRLMYVGITRAKRSLHISWCKKRRRSQEMISCEASRFIEEMQLTSPFKTDPTETLLTPKDRLATLKALLTP